MLAVEYPGYGLYKGDPHETQILEDSEVVFLYIKNTLGFLSSNVIVSGRSMGSGPSIHLASKFKVKMLVLVSPFLSIKEVTKHLFGALASMVIKERFDNQSKMEKVGCPTIVIHGHDDKLVPFDHAVILKSTFFVIYRSFEKGVHFGGQCHK